MQSGQHGYPGIPRHCRRDASPTKLQPHSWEPSFTLLLLQPTCNTLRPRSASISKVPTAADRPFSCSEFKFERGGDSLKARWQARSTDLALASAEPRSGLLAGRQHTLVRRRGVPRSRRMSSVCLDWHVAPGLDLIASLRSIHIETLTVPTDRRPIGLPNPLVTAGFGRWNNSLQGLESGRSGSIGELQSPASGPHVSVLVPHSAGTAACCLSISIVERWSPAPTIVNMRRGGPSRCVVRERYPRLLSHGQDAWWWGGE